MDKSLIEQVRQANDIVEVVQSYLPLKHIGSNWRGICPFHNDTRPSFYVSQPKQIYKCFACGKAGNVFGFVQDFEKITFIEAVKKLAGRAGIPIPEWERTTVVSTKRQQLLAVYKSAGLFFSESLFKHGEGVLDYLKARQISPETAKALELGYALPSEKALLNHLMKEGYGVSLLKESGLFGLYSGALTDLFRDRLMFPIHNTTSEVIAFGGRIMQDKAELGKYMNSPGTELYTKGKELYGLFKTKYNISKADCSLVCEGYFDFLRLYESGFTNCVASLGTALTEEQVYLLNRYSSRTYMLYDGDSAGLKAAIRGGLLCLAKGMEVRIVDLPDKEDPDTFILNRGKDALQALLDTAPNLIAFMASSDKPEQAVKERIDLLLDAIRHIHDAVQSELLLKEISTAFGISESALKTNLRRSSRTPAQTPVESAPSINGEAEDERNLLIMALRDVQSYKLLATELSADYFNNRLYQRLYKHLQENVLPEDVGDAAALMDSIENNELKECLAELLFEDLQHMSLENLVNDIKLRKTQRDLEALDKAITENPSNLELLKQKAILSRNYRLMTKKVVNKVLF
ncbi:MAG TPA: DNA primase [Candidatus Cloacimonadota bacterium]|nr:DNA primase [Candidatus Cloacimonadota bacterium]